MPRCRAIRDDGGEIFARPFALPVRSEQAREFDAIYFVVGRECAQFLPTTDREIELGKLGGRVGGERERLIVVDVICGFRQFDARVLEVFGPDPEDDLPRASRRWPAPQVERHAVAGEAHGLAVELGAYEVHRRRADERGDEEVGGCAEDLERRAVLMHLPAASRPRVLDTLAGLGRGPLVATVCHPYTLKSLVRALRRAFGGRAKRSPRLTRRMLAGEVAAAGLELGRVIRVMPLLSEVWVVVVRKPGSTS